MTDPGTSTDPPSQRAMVRVLVVDDYPDMRELLHILFDRQPGYVVIGEAADGEQAITVAREIQPDLVLLDLAMPRMDGLQALPGILAAAPGVRVVVFTGCKYDSFGRQALEGGASGFIVKGTPLSAIIAELDNVMAP